MPSKKDLDHHLHMNGNLWSIRLVLPKRLGGKRVEYPTGTADVRIARKIRDRVLSPLFEETVSSEITRQLLDITSKSDSRSQSLIRLAHEEFGTVIPSGPTLQEAAQLFIANRRDFKQRSAGMVADYVETLASLSVVLGNPKLSTISSSHLRSFRDTMLKVKRFWNRNGQGDLSSAPAAERLNPVTVIKMMRNISSFFQWAVNEEILERNPVRAVDLPARQRRFTPSPPAHLANNLCTLPHPRSQIVGVLEWEVLPWFFRFTGARLGEVSVLTAEDVVEEHGVRCLRLHTEKTTMRAVSRQGAVIRLVPVHPNLVPYLDRALAKHPTGPLFPGVGNRWSAALRPRATSKRMVAVV